MSSKTRRSRKKVAGDSAVVGAAAALLLALAPAGMASAAPVSATAFTTLSANVIPHLAQATDTGLTAGSTHIMVDLTLARPDPAGEKAFEAALYSKGSPMYHQFPTAAQYATRFGVPAAARAQALAFARSGGLQVVHAAATGDVMVLSGTVAQAESTFKVLLHDYRIGATRFFANATGPTVPAGIGVNGVIGLDNLLRSAPVSTSSAHPVGRTATTGTAAGVLTSSSVASQFRANAVTTLQASALPSVARPFSAPAGGSTRSQGGCNAGVCTGLTTPQDLWSIYNLPDSNKGNGQTMAIFGEGQTDPVIANLRTFESVHGLPEVPARVVHTDGATADYTDNSGEIEWDLDTQSSTGMAPNVVSESLYFGASLTDASTLSVLTNWVSDPAAPLQASASYGECEQNPLTGPLATGAPSTDPGYAGSAGSMYTVNYEAQLQMAVNTGKTLFASTGDTGSSCPVVATSVGGLGAGNGVVNQGFPVVNYPASSPHVVAVGGTVLYGTDPTSTTPPKPTQRSQEYAWTFTGGGTSDQFPKPTYQSQIGTIAGACVIQPDSTPAIPGTVCRGIPDIAAQSGDVVSNGYAIVAGGNTAASGGGTSLSSPLSLGMWTRIQAASTSGLGFASSTYYAQATKDLAVTGNPTDVRDFFDVGGAANSQPSGNGFFTALPRSAADPTGWDYVSGLGVPNYGNVMIDVTGRTMPTNPTVPLPVPAGGGTTATPIDTACVPLFTDPVGDDKLVGDPNGGGSNPQLDIVQGDMHTRVRPSDGVTVLETVMTIHDLSTNGASAGGAANEYYFLWTVGSTQYFTVAQVDSLTRAVTYGHGTVVGTRFTNAGGAGDTGQFNVGPNGTVVVQTPLTVANVGAVKPGEALMATAAQTRVLVGSGATGGLIEQADTTMTGYAYTLGETCPATGRQGSSGGTAGGPNAVIPETAVTVVLPLAGAGLLAGGALFLRRRRDGSTTA